MPALTARTLLSGLGTAIADITPPLVDSTSRVSEEDENLEVLSS